MKVYRISPEPKQYLNKLTTSGINIVNNKGLEALKTCLLKKNSAKSVEGFFIVLNETPVNKNNRGLINLEVINHFNSNKRNLSPEWIRCVAWRGEEELGTFFDIVLKKFGKNKKRLHYTDMKKVCTQIIDECKKLSEGKCDSGFYHFNKLVEELKNLRDGMCH